MIDTTVVPHLVFGLGLLYSGIHDLKHARLSYSALTLMCLAIIIYFVQNYNTLASLSDSNLLSRLGLAFILILSVLSFPIALTTITRRVYIYFVDCLVVALIILINVDRLIVFIYYLVFLPLAFVVYLVISRRRSLRIRNRAPFLFVLAMSVGMAELFLYVI